MIATRWRKVVRDIAETPGRTAIAVAAMTAGVFGVGMILTSYTVLRRELASTYSRTRPASATLIVSGSTDAASAALRGAPGVLDVEPRPVIRGRIRVGDDEWAPLVLFVIRDFRDLRIDTFRFDRGHWPPASGEVLIERASLTVARAHIGDRITMRTGSGAERVLEIGGTVHAAGMAPGWMDHVVSGFIGLDSVARIGDGSEESQVRLVVDGDRGDVRHIRATCASLQAWLRERGQAVTRVDVPAPGRHPHADQMDTFLLLLGGFGVLTLILSAILMATMIHALLSEQIRQVGIMKAIGATTGQIGALYLGQVSILAALSLLIGIPLGSMAGRGYTRFAATILNATIENASAPIWVFVLQIAVGLATPLVLALGPVLMTARITVHEALGDNLGRRPSTQRPLDRWLAGIRLLPRPWMLSLRTAMHRRGRLILTVATLAMGGAVFLSALNVSAAWSHLLGKLADARRYDLDVRLSRLYPTPDVVGSIASLPTVASVESWIEVGVRRIGPGGEEAGRVLLVGAPADAKSLRLPIVDGRWLVPADEGTVVVSQTLFAADPALRPGNSIRLRINERTASWKIVGVAEEIVGMTAYAPEKSVREALGRPVGVTRNLRVVTKGHDVRSQLAAEREVERALERSGIHVGQVQSVTDFMKAIADHLVIIESALVLAAMLVVLVGALSLMSTLTLNVVQRTREIGILSAIGASPRAVFGQVVGQGLLMGSLSWLLSIALAVPFTVVLDDIAGRIFHKMPLELVISGRAAAMWLVLSAILATLSSLYPARRAVQLTIREALTYE